MIVLGAYFLVAAPMVALGAAPAAHPSDATKHLQELGVVEIAEPLRAALAPALVGTKIPKHDVRLKQREVLLVHADDGKVIYSSVSEKTESNVATQSRETTVFYKDGDASLLVTLRYTDTINVAKHQDWSEVPARYAAEAAIRQYFVSSGYRPVVGVDLGKKVQSVEFIIRIQPMNTAHRAGELPIVDAIVVQQDGGRYVFGLPEWCVAENPQIEKATSGAGWVVLSVQAGYKYVSTEDAIEQWNCSATFSHVIRIRTDGAQPLATFAGKNLPLVAAPKP